MKYRQVTPAAIIDNALAALFFALFIVALVALAYGCGPDVETLVRSFR